MTASMSMELRGESGTRIHRWESSAERQCLQPREWYRRKGYITIKEQKQAERALLKVDGASKEA